MNRFRKFMILLCSCLSVFALSFAFAACGESTGGGQTLPDGDPAPADKTYTVTLDFDAANGTIVLSPIKDGNVYKEGDTVTATVTPKSGRTLSSFTVNGTEAQLSDGVYTFEISADTALKAVFSTVPMDGETFSSLFGELALEGTGSGMRTYDDYEEFELQDSFAYKTVFDEDTTLRYKRDDGYSLILNNDVFRNEGGKAVLYKRTAENEIQKTATEDSFETYCNPFGTVLSAEDFILTGTDVYSAVDLEKASLAAQAITGVKETLASFRLFVWEGAVERVAFSTELKQHGEGVTMGYTYYIDYEFTVKAGEDLSSYLTPHEAGEEHVALERALQAAHEANSYTYTIDEVWSEEEQYHYPVYITNDAYWCETEEEPFGFAVKDGYVYEISLSEGKLVFSENKLQMDGVDEEGVYGYHDVTDIAEILAHFALVKPAMFEAKGDGVFELRPQDSNLAPILAQWLYDGNDTVTMLYAKAIKITVDNETVKKIEIRTTMFSEECTFTFTYSNWDSTTLPYPLEKEEEQPQTEIPEKFYGEFEGSYTDFSTTVTYRYAVVISAENVTVSIDGEAQTVTDVAYDSAQDKITLKLNGKSYTIENFSEGDMVDEINLSGESWDDPMVTLTRKGADGGTQGGGEPFGNT